MYLAMEDPNVQHWMCLFAELWLFGIYEFGQSYSPWSYAVLVVTFIDKFSAMC